VEREIDIGRDPMELRASAVDAFCPSGERAGEGAERGELGLLLFIGPRGEGEGAAKAVGESSGGGSH
jgi:hypothetical protein